MKYLFLLGRVLFSAIFIIKSWGHFSNSMIEHAANWGVPFASVLVPATGILALLGGLSLLLGYRAKLGAWLLVAFLLPTAFIMHNFWKAENPMEAMLHNYCFWKNLSMLGAALMISYFGAGPMSLDTKHKRA